MDKEYKWSEIRDQAIEDFGEAPGSELEQEILDQFKTQPTIVVAQIDQVTRGVQKGTVRSGWAVLRSILRTPSPEAVVKDEGRRDKRVRAATAWVGNAGLYCENPDQVLDELFGSSGLLHEWRSDNALQRQMVQLWLKFRPMGQEAEISAEAYQRSFAKRPKKELVSPAGGATPSQTD